MFALEPLDGHRLAVHDLLRRTVQDHANVAGVWEWDVTDTMARLDALRAEGRSVGLAALFIKASAVVVDKHPRLNRKLLRRWFGLREVVWDEISANVIVERTTASGRPALFPVVLRNVDQMSVEAIHTELRRLKTQDLDTLPEVQQLRKVRRAPRWVLKLFDYLLRTRPAFHIARFGTYAVSSLIHEGSGGVSGTVLSPSTSFYPGNLEWKPVVRDGEVVVRRMMNVGMCVDHYVIDGLDVIRAAADLQRLIEDPSILLG